MRTHGGVAQGVLRGAVPSRFICTRFARAILGVLCLFLTLLCHAQAAKYFYDANGRLVAMARDDGTAARYVYDAMGNVTEVRAEPAGALRLFSFIPTHGAPGTPVTLYGQGFDGSALSVSFNGVVGSIQSSTANELHTAVPDGATTGPITVSAGGQSVASDTPFVVDDTGLAPQITGVAPTVVATGDTVTVSGSHLHPTTGQSTVSIGGVALSPASATNAQIQFAVPSGAGSGKVAVSTTYGQATSAEDLVVVPTSIGAANVVASTRVVVDGAAGPGVSIGAGKYGAILFDATVGSWISVQLDQFTTTTSNVNYSVYDPVGRLVVRGSMSPQAPTIHLPQTAITGTYTVLVQPDNAGMQFQARAESALRISIDGNDLPFSTVSGGESKRILFTGQSGDNLEVALSGVSVTGGTPYNDWVRFTVYDPANRTIAGVGMGDRNSTRLWGVTGGTFQLIVSPGGGSGGLLKIQSAIATLTRDIVGPPLAYGTTATLNLPRPGQTMRQTFTANAGDMVTLVANAIATTPANNNVYFTIYRPDGGQLTSFNTTSAATWNLDSLPDSGTYMVVTTGAWGTPNTTQLTLLHGVTDTLTVDGPSKSYTTTVRGQNIYLSFNANAGDNLELALSNVSVSGGVPYNDWLTVGVYDSNGRYVASFNSTSGNNTHLWGLGTGTYRIVITPYGSSSGPLQIQNANVTLTRDIIGPPITYGAATTVNLPRPGQAARMTFTASAGDNVALVLNAVTTNPTNNSAFVAIYRPDGGQVTNVYTSSPATWNLANLPQSGTYTMVVWTNWGSSGTVQLTLLSGVTDTLVADGPSKSYATAAPGQNIYLSFNANAGDNLELALSNVSVIGGNGITAGVYDSNGRYVTSFDSAGGNNTHLWGLTAGTYRIVITPYGSSSGALQIQNVTATLTRDIIGPELTYGAATTVNLPRPGQAMRLTFTANAGDNVTLALNAVTTNPANNSAFVAIYRPDGGQVTNVYTSSPATWNLANLPQSGTYTMVVWTNWGGSGTVQLTLLGGVTDALAVDGPSKSYATAAQGQNISLSFNANAGDNLELALTGVSVSGGSPYNDWVRAGVYDSSGRLIANFGTGSGDNAHLWGLAGGTYSMVITPGGSPSGPLRIQNATVTLTRDITGLQLANGMATTVDLPRPGQAARLTFSGNAGDAPTLVANAITTTPAGNYVYFTIYRPDGTQWTSVNGTSPTSWALPALPQSGTYTVLVTVSYGLPANVQLTLNGVTGS